MYPYDLKTNKKTSNHNYLKSFISMVKSTNNQNSYDTFNQITHYNSFIKYLAIWEGIYILFYTILQIPRDKLYNYYEG